MTSIAQRLRSAFVEEPSSIAASAYPASPVVNTQAVAAPLCLLFDTRPLSGYLGCALALIAGQTARAPYVLAVTCCGGDSSPPRLRRPAGLAAARASRSLNQAGFAAVASGRLVHLGLGSELSSRDVADAVTVARSTVAAPTVVTVGRERDGAYEPYGAGGHSFAGAEFCFAGLDCAASAALRGLAASSIRSIAPGGALAVTLTQRDALRISLGVVPQTLRDDVAFAMETPAL